MRGRVGIIGGGVAGLSAAYFLQQQGFQPVVYEAAPVLGGLASTLEVEPGIWIERFYHFLCQPDVHLLRLADELGLGGRIRWRDTRMGLFYQGEMHPFGRPTELMRFRPLSVTDRLRVGLHVLRSRRMNDWHLLDGVTAEEWLRRELGDNAYRVIWEPLLSMKFGDRHREISAAWIWSRIARVAKSRHGIRQIERLGYIEGGTGALLAALDRRLEGRIRLGTQVDAIEVENGRVAGLRVGGRLQRFDAVVSTVPLRILARIATGLSRDYLQQLECIDYIGVSCLLLKLKRSFSPYFWTNVSDAAVPFAGAIEFTRLNPLPELRGQSILYVPHYLSPEEERFEWDLDRTLQAYLPAMKRINPDFRQADIADAYLNKAPFAQVVCPVGFAALVPPFKSTLEGLFLTDSTQLYPEDRVISDLIRCAEQVSRLVAESIPGGAGS